MTRKDDDLVALLSHIIDSGAPAQPSARARPAPAALDSRANVIDLVTISAWAMDEYARLLRRLGDVEVHNVARVLDDGALLLSCSARTGHFVLRLDAQQWHWRRPPC
jgi:hypothetical protein